MTFVAGGHHLTMCVGGAQEDVDFHTKLLGMRLIKRTVLFDGTTPVYHLYYSNQNGEPGSILTTFPFGQAGIKGRRGTNQSKEILLSVPEDSIDFWRRRLENGNVETRTLERFGTERLAFQHPAGIDYQFVAVAGDPREGYRGTDVPQEFAIHGAYGMGVDCFSPEANVEFIKDFFTHNDVLTDGDSYQVTIGAENSGGVCEMNVNRHESQGSWIYGDGTIHHFALNMGDAENQDAVKLEIEGSGYTDISELKDRKYFKSVYVRSPSGSLFELAITDEAGGWNCDESPEELGTKFQLPGKFESRREEILSQLETIEA
ncbi:ring-cleaving dioxygenase [Corynebacterium nasicanis]|uniref:Ring-cleaving dioxygenase n=1 Tax=Corynebacterium nasicanis TaxID=1448267 RepID=A0ABW1QE15_9CORY